MAPCGIGLGHITRAVPIAKELNARGVETVFSTYLDGLEYAKHIHLPTYEAVPIYFKLTNDGAIDFKMTAATSGFSLGVRRFLRQVTREIDYMKQFKPDVVFSDSRASSLVAARLLRIPVVLMLNQFRVEIIRRPTGRKLSPLDRLFFFIANIGWLFVRTALQLVWSRSQIILVPDLAAPFTISAGNLAIPRRYNGKVKLIGPIIENDQQEATLNHRGQVRGRKPLVYAAVSGPKVERRILSRLLTDVLGALAKEYNVVISRGEPNGHRTPRLRNGVRVHDWIDDQDSLIEKSEVVISRAGHGTIMKSLIHGKPMILIPIPDHTEQYGNARRAKSLNVAEIIDQPELDSATLKAAIDEILQSELYRNSCAAIRVEAAAMHAVQAACDGIIRVAPRSNQ
jgi:UDP:flavonoid glycosyltransferase YjiC (YdhE family)